MCSKPALEVILQLTSKYLSDIRSVSSRYNYAPNFSIDHLEEILLDWTFKGKPEDREIEVENVEMGGQYIHMSVSSGALAPGHSSMDLPMVSESQILHVPSLPKELENTANTTSQKLISINFDSPTDQTPPRQKKVSGRPTKFPLMQSQLCKWITHNHTINNKSPLKQKNLVLKASELQRLYYPDQSFNASKGWFERFSQRHPLEFSYTMRHNKPRYSASTAKKQRREKQRKEEIFRKRQAMMMSQDEGMGEIEQNAEMRSQGVFIEENLSPQVDDNFKMAVKVEFNPDDCIL